MGGMLVVFVYSTALSAERYPKVSKIKEVIFLCGIFFVWVVLNFDNLIKRGFVSWSGFCKVDLIGRSLLYREVWYYLILVGYVLLIALVVALVITYGSEYNILKAL